MAHGLFAYHAQAQAISATLAQLPAIADTSLQPINSAVPIPGGLGGAPALNKLAGYLVVGATVTSAQFQSPSLAGLFYPDLNPLDVSATPTSPSKWVDLTQNPIELPATEQLRAYITNTAADVESLLIQLTDGAYANVAGEVQTVKASGTTTLSAGLWTNVPITISQNLPVGRYQVVGMRYEGATAIAGRLVFTGAYWRPGCPGHTAKSDLDYPKFRRGGFGVWGEFSTSVIPSVDCLASAADTAQTIYLDLVQVSSQA